MYINIFAYNFFQRHIAFLRTTHAFTQCVIMDWTNVAVVTRKTCCGWRNIKALLVFMSSRFLRMKPGMWFRTVKGWELQRSWCKVLHNTVSEIASVCPKTATKSDRTRRPFSFLNVGQGRLTVLSLWTVRLQVVFGLPSLLFLLVSRSLPVLIAVTVLVLVGLNSQMLKLQYNYDSHTFI